METGITVGITVEITAGECVEALSAFSGITGKLSIDTIWAIDDIKEVLAKPVTRHSNEKTALLEHYGRKQYQVGAQMGFKIPPENQESYAKEHQALDDIKLKLQFTPLDYDTLMNQGAMFDPRYAKILRKFIIRRVLPKKGDTPSPKDGPLSVSGSD